jgi:hypothetical protein
MAGWASLKLSGYEGLQAILGGSLESKAYLRHPLDVEHDELTCTNPDDYGLATLRRAYPKGTDGDTQFTHELTSPDARDELGCVDKSWQPHQGRGEIEEAFIR